MMAPLVLAAAYALDGAFGEPPNRLHPVAWMGSIIGHARRWALGAQGRWGQLARGAIVALAIPAAFAAMAHVVVNALGRSVWLATLGTALLLKPMFAVRALRDAAFTVRDALECGDVASARRGLGSLCSRKADHLEKEALVAATVESIAENISDSVVAPLLFFACFGLEGAVFYRAVNTLDAMMGYHGHLEYAGKAAARLDDLANLVPARFAALLLLVAGALTGARVGRGIAILRRDGARTESPNAGWPMATMAGLLGVRLTKPDHYALGDAVHPLEPAHITAAWRIASLAALGSLVTSALLSRGLHG
ncbi:adenosylcobinamide-phosphate synthase CbiB [Pendulispora brunnea]|uniref:Cobalamin biosynthesis protein CobD n=1 Tax=Pendulispora brunnea TaxID=2905690 RepID=A0ABZ2KA83_9BACT